MSLRTDYTGAIDTKLAEARTTGRDFILIDNLATITTNMASAAAQGKKTFTLTIAVAYQPQDLRLEGSLWEAYKSGVEEAMSSEDVMGNEVVVSLNTSDTINTSIDLAFSF